jgi:hypothetical protein
VFKIGDCKYLEKILQSKGVKTPKQYKDFLSKMDSSNDWQELTKHLCQNGSIDMASFLNAKTKGEFNIGRLMDYNGSGQNCMHMAVTRN